MMKIIEPKSVTRTFVGMSDGEKKINPHTKVAQTAVKASEVKEVPRLQARAMKLVSADSQSIFGFLANTAHAIAQSFLAAFGSVNLVF